MCMCVRVGVPFLRCTKSSLTVYPFCSACMCGFVSAFARYVPPSCPDCIVCSRPCLCTPRAPSCPACIVCSHPCLRPTRSAGMWAQPAWRTCYRSCPTSKMRHRSVPIKEAQTTLSLAIARAPLQGRCTIGTTPKHCEVQDHLTHIVLLWGCASLATHAGACSG